MNTALAMVFPIIDSQYTVEISSKQISSQLVNILVNNKLKNSIGLEPGMLFDIPDTYITDIDLGDKLSKKINIPVYIKKNEMYVQKFSLTFDFVYKEIKYDDNVDKLFVSNNPEEVKYSGTLLSGEIFGAETARLILYHKNSSSKLQDVTVLLKNEEKYSQKVYVALGFGGPNRGGLFAGHLATKRFYRSVMSNEGGIIEIPPGGTAVVFEKIAKVDQVVSGIFRIKKINKGRLTVSTAMIDNESMGMITQIDHEEENKGHVGGVFNGGTRIIRNTYYAGEDIENIRIGDQPFLTDNEQGLELRGNYGLNYKLELELINSSRRQKKINLFFVPSGGIARGIFLVDNKIIETGLLNPIYWNDMSKIISVDLVPGETRRMVLYTMPQPGSFYPVNIVINTEL